MLLQGKTVQNTERRHGADPFEIPTARCRCGAHRSNDEAAAGAGRRNRVPDGSSLFKVLLRALLQFRKVGRVPREEGGGGEEAAEDDRGVPEFGGG